MPQRAPKKPTSRAAAVRTFDVLDVEMTAPLLMVSADTVYDLFKSGELPGRKIGRKWMTTRGAVLRWIERSAAEHTRARALGHGDKQARHNARHPGRAQGGKRQDRARRVEHRTRTPRSFTA
jgi:excisionase family DNA binding protein